MSTVCERPAHLKTGGGAYEFGSACRITNATLLATASEPRGVLRTLHVGTACRSCPASRPRPMLPPEWVVGRTSPR